MRGYILILGLLLSLGLVTGQKSTLRTQRHPAGEGCVLAYNCTFCLYENQKCAFFLPTALGPEYGYCAESNKPSRKLHGPEETKIVNVYACHHIQEGEMTNNEEMEVNGTTLLTTDANDDWVDLNDKMAYLGTGEWAAIGVGIVLGVVILAMGGYMLWKRFSRRATLRTSALLERLHRDKVLPCDMELQGGGGASDPESTEEVEDATINEDNLPEDQSLIDNQPGPSRAGPSKPVKNQGLGRVEGTVGTLRSCAVTGAGENMPTIDLTAADVRRYKAKVLGGDQEILVAERAIVKGMMRYAYLDGRGDEHLLQKVGEEGVKKNRARRQTTALVMDQW